MAKNIMGIAIGILFAVVVATIAWSADGLANTNFTANAPAWVVTLLGVGTGFALVRAVSR